MIRRKSTFFLPLLFAFALSGFTPLNAQTPPVEPAESLEKNLGLHFYGDVRYRFTYLVQGQDYAPTDDSSTPLWIDHRLNYRIRARIGAEKDFGGEAKAGLCFITSGTGDPTDPYWTLSGGATFLNVGLDQAYVSLSPKALNHVVTLSVGKIANPLAYTPITWSEDVMPEGMGLTVDPSKDTHFKLLYFRLQDNGPATIDGAGADPFMAEVQVQQQLDLGDAQVALTAGYQYVSNVYSFETGDAAVSSYMNVTPSLPPGAPLSITSKGMVGDNSSNNVIPEMHVVEGILNVSHTIGEEKIPVLWTLHGALNLSSFTINAATNTNVKAINPGLNDPNDLALFAGVEVGKAEQAGKWAGGLQWAYIQPDAVFSAFNDPNPGLGHNNNTWFMGQVEMGLEDGLRLDLAQYVDWRADYDVFGPSPSDIIGTTSRDPMLTTRIDLTAKL